MWKLSDNQHLPIYQQIIKLIEQKINSGQLLTGEKLPAERKLAELLGVNRSTVIRAFDELVERGVLIRRRGSGTTINQDKWGVAPQQTTNWRHYVDQSSFLPASPYIRKTHVLLKNPDNDILDLATGELPLDLIPEITMPSYSWRDLIAEEKNEEIEGYFPLRQTIQHHLLNRQQILALPEQILITSGAQQALFMITQCLLRPGDTIAIESPSYLYALPLFQSAGLRIVALPMDKEGIQPDDLERLYHKFAIKMVFLNPTLQNPTGLMMPQQRRKEIIALCTKLNLPIVEDHSYAELSFDHTAQPPTLKQLDHQNVLYIGSLSKVMGSMTRIGWLVGPAAVIKHLAEARQEMDFGLSIFPQVLANHVLNNTSFHQHLTRLRDTLKHRCDDLISALNNTIQEDIDFAIPQGGMHLWCKLHPSYNITRVTQKLLEQNMLVMPAGVFGSKENALRLTFARLNKDVAQLAAFRLQQVLKDP
ncbi:MocR-like pyridoxine biosynthesis transcription factor PdxR [Zophobihabitans entericus]|uniref:PLP-dependent aminotransferase family protein n=1 Tax=Zophobihabitans entericus TaxID=1635327 RepID=A0A6G9I9H6_9GAMM|nr:PLP-dependent aminotransferase family protein [Zophobihabitans entericus]QIQ20230.1 PLP-dependent aminotransferase family protein [Zophobihabitans entericus]